MSVGIEFVGGPIDGKQYTIRNDPMNPPLTIEILADPPLGWGERDADGVLPLHKLLYRREVSTSDDGPLWRYRYDRRASVEAARPGPGS